MNKIFFFAVALLLCNACTSRPEGFVVRGSFPGLRDGMKVVLQSMESEETFAVDTVRGKKFELKGWVKSPRYCNLLIYTGDTTASGVEKMVNTYLFLDNSVLRMNVAHLDSMEFVHPFMAEFAIPKARVEGGLLQQEYYEYRDILLPLQLALSKADGDVAMLNFGNNDYTPEEYDRQFDELYPRRQAAEEAVDAAKMEFIRRHPNSPLSLFIAGGLLNHAYTRTREEVEELTRLVAGMDDTVRRPLVLKMAEAAQTLYKGAAYKELELTDVKGCTVKLSQYFQPGCYTLVDFWASWCAPCRWAIPQVEKLYKRYDRTRLSVISVSFDQNQADWEKAMEEENMPWVQLWAGNSGQMTAAQQAYRISGIPRLLLITPDGTIAFSGNNADALRLAIEKYLGK